MGREEVLRGTTPRLWTEKRFDSIPFDKKKTFIPSGRHYY